MRDERVQRSKETVLHATFQLITEGGLGGVSVDEVCKRSGVAKTTIYRHWPSRSALLLDACNRLSGPHEADTGTLKGDLMALTLGIAERLKAPQSSILPSIIDAAERDPDVAKLQACQIGEMSDSFGMAIERGRQRGEFIPKGETCDIVAMLVGPLFYHRWFSRSPIDPYFVRRLVNQVLTVPAEF